MGSYRIVLADDHVLFRQGLRKILEEQAQLEVIGEVGDGLELIRLLKATRPDMILLDITMPNMRGIEAAREIKVVCPQARILILTMHKSKEYLYHSISAGAQGYLLKEDADTELFSAIKTVREGHVYISPHLSVELAEEFLKMCQGDYHPPHQALTNRERQVVKLIAEGKTNREISLLLYISIRTVENHRANIMKKLNLKNTIELIKYAIREQYISINN